MQSSPIKLYTPQVKICGLTSAEAASACADLGADAIGCIFFPKSPRNLTEQQAGKICGALPSHVKKVGVFVDAAFAAIMRKVERCGLTAVQLHGRESPQLVNDLLAENIPVIKALFAAGTPHLSNAHQYRASALLVECGRGVLPGGTAQTWDWRQARPISNAYPVILAGGLSPDNVVQAIAAGRPAAVDVSSGVEKAPGIKDLLKVKAFLEAVRGCASRAKSAKIF